jgi:hypothetical protein
MNKWLSILIGLILLIGGISGGWIICPSWGESAITFLKGGIIWMILLIGGVVLFLGMNDLRN